MSCGPRAGFAELRIPENEPGSSIMPGKINPTQAEALTMIAVQVMGNDVAVGFAGASGYLEMNVYKTVIIHNVLHSLTILTDGCTNFRKYLVDGTKPNLKRIKGCVDNSLMLVTALTPVIGYDKAAKIANYAAEHELTLKAAALELKIVSEAEFDQWSIPHRWSTPTSPTRLRPGGRLHNQVCAAQSSPPEWIGTVSWPGRHQRIRQKRHSPGMKASMSSSSGPASPGSLPRLKRMTPAPR